MAGRSRVSLLFGAAAVAVIAALGAWLLGGDGGGGPAGDGPGKGPGGTAPVPVDGGGPARREPAGGGPATDPAAGSLRGSLSGADGPMAGRIEVSWGEGAGARTAEASAAVGGGFVVTGIPAGTVRLRASAPGWRAAVREGLEVRSGETTDLGSLLLERSLPLAGRVLDPAGRPVAGARVGALGEAAGFLGLDIRTLVDGLYRDTPWLDEGVSGADGTFRLESLGAGTYTLVARARGFAPGRSDGVLLHPAGTARPVDISLQPSHPLRVVVVDAAEAPVAGASVAGLLTTGRDAVPTVADRVLATTDGAGEALLEGLPPGSVAVAVRSADGRMAIRNADVPRTSEVRIPLGGAGALLVRVRDADGAPVEGAEVSAFVEGGGRGNTVLLRGRTGADGDIRFAELAPGTLMAATAEKEGMAPAGQGISLFGGRGETVEIRDGETAEKDLLLGPGAVVSGVVRRRADGSPVEGARVTLVMPSFLLFGAERETRSGAEGAFRFEGVPEGEAVLAATTETAASPFDPRSFFNPRRDAEAKVAVPAGPAEVAKDLHLDELGSVSGRVTGPDGGGVSGAVVSAGGGGRGGFLGLPSAGPPDVLTGAEGDYRLTGVRPGGSITVAATAAGLLGGSSAPVALAAGGEARGVDIRLTAGGVLEGRVTGAGGSPVEGASVRASPRRPGGRIPAGDLSPPMPDFGGESPSTRTDPEGSYRIPGIPPGTLSVTVEAEGFQQENRGDVAVLEGASTRADFSLEPGHLLAGVVLDPAGKPVQGATVSARAADGERAPGVPRPRGASAITDGAGAFRITTLPPGLWNLTVSATGLPSRTLQGVASGTGGLEVRLPPAMAIRGRVTGPAGEPIRRATVQARVEGESGSSGSGRTGDDGAFEIQRLAPGSYTLAVWVPGNDYSRTEVPGVAAGADAVLLVVPRALTLSGRVLGPDGGAPPRGFLRLHPVDGGNATFGGNWDADGTFTVRGVAPGRYEVRARTRENPPMEGMAVAGAGDEGVEIRLKSP